VKSTQRKQRAVLQTATSIFNCQSSFELDAVFQPWSSSWQGSRKKTKHVLCFFCVGWYEKWKTSSVPQVSIGESLHARTENSLTESANDPKLEEAALEDRITAHTDLNRSKTSSKNDQSVWGGEQQNTVFYKNHPWHKHMTENNWTVRREWSKSQAPQEPQQRNTTAKRYTLHSWPIHTRNLLARVLHLVSGPVLPGRHGSAQAPTKEPW